MKKNTPEEFKKAVEYEKRVKAAYNATDEFKDAIYDVSIHQNNNLENFAQEKDHEQLDMFDAECEGMCGV